MPTKTLYLLRHAEASQAESGISDYDRSLTPHGEDQAIEVANYIRNKIINFDFVMCSSALRTQQTLEPIPFNGVRNCSYLRQKISLCIMDSLWILSSGFCFKLALNTDDYGRRG